MTDKSERGTVKWFDGTRGYGFIVPDNGGDDVMIHKTRINSRRDLARMVEGARVEFARMPDKNDRAMWASSL